MGGKAPETWWATHKRQVINLWNSCILLVDLFESYDDARTSERQTSWVYRQTLRSIHFISIILKNWVHPSQNIHWFFFDKNNKTVIYIYNTYYCLLYYYFRILCAAYRMFNCFVESTLTLRRLMSYIYIYIYIWSTHSWCF